MSKIIILIIFVAVVLGGVYFFLRSGEDKRESAVQGTAAVEEVSTNDTVAVVDQELQATELENLDAGFADIETEIEAALSEL